MAAEGASDRAGRATFADPRYALARMREAKAPYLAQRVGQCPKPRRVLWGAGPTGRRVARDLARHGLPFALFIDIDPKKIGRTAQGAPIASMEALDVRTDVVVAAVGARGARDLIRPALYQAYHPIKLGRASTAKEVPCVIAGPICESSDIFARDRFLPEDIQRGDILEIGCAGAYGFAMSSQYNARPRLAEVLVDGNSHRLVRKAFSAEDYDAATLV